VTELLGHLRSEDPHVREEAAALIWKRYCAALLQLAYRNLDRRLQRRVGADDIVQRTFQSFFLRQRRGDFDLTDRHDLFQLLVRMTRNKAGSAATKEARQRRDYRRERTQAEPGVDGREDGDWLLRQAQRRGPSPDEAAALAEEAERRLGQLPDDLKRVALWKLAGHTNAEIAALPEMNCTVRTVERKLRLIREVWCGPSG
jgi:DNA-directed RNA polymerase specialized sigma24 family protein